MFRAALLSASRSNAVKSAVTKLPVTSGIVARYVPGDDMADAVRASQDLVLAGLEVTADYLGEDTVEPAQAEAAAAAYIDLLDHLVAAGLTPAVEVSIKLTALGLGLPDGHRTAAEHARAVCTAAERAGTTVTLDMEDHTVTDATLAIQAELRDQWPWVGTVLQSYLKRTEADCRELAAARSRVRLCKGAYQEPAEVAFQDRQQVDLSYVRCLKVLMKGDGYPMVATHDPRLVDIALDLAARTGRGPEDFELQMLYGIRPNEQRRLASAGHRVRVYLPFGHDWYGYLIRRLAERPANLGFFARSLLTRS